MGPGAAVLSKPWQRVGTRRARVHLWHLENECVLGRARVEPPINRRGGLRMRWSGIGSISFVLKSGTDCCRRLRQVLLPIGGRCRVEPPD